MDANTLTVLTGDIVGSTRLDPTTLDRALARLDSAADIAMGWNNPGRPAKFTRYRGDGWQCLSSGPHGVLRTILYLRACLRALDRKFETRISIGHGTGSATDDSLSSASGVAFELAGRGLDSMIRPQCFVYATDPRDDPSLADRRGLFVLADQISQKWTMAQARVFERHLPPDAPNQKSIGAVLGISQQMVAKHLRAGGGWALDAAIAEMERHGPDGRPYGVRS